MRQHYLPLSLLIVIGTLLLSFVSSVTPTEGSVTAVVTNRYNNLRTGSNLNETVLTASNVGGGSFGKLFERPVQGDIYAQPLYVGGVNIPGKGTHNVVYVATAHNMVYAFDADDPTPAGNVPLWYRDLNYLGPVFSDPNFFAQRDIWDMELGVLSTPVIDLASQTMYLVSEHSCGTGCAAHYLHKLNITNGADVLSAVQIQAAVAGTGDDLDKGLPGDDGMVTFRSQYQLQRTGLLLLNGTIYLAFGSTQDLQPFHGWVMAYNAANLQQTKAFNTTPDGNGGGIWQSGTGIATDGTSLYVVTGNGTFNADTNGHDYGDTILRLTQNLTVASYFTPYNQDFLSTNDLDLGINGAMLLPNSNLALSGSKQGILYLVDRTDMAGFGADDGHPEIHNQIVQAFFAANGHMHSTPIFWDVPSGTVLYIWTEQDYPKAFAFNKALYNDGNPNTFPVNTIPIATGTVTTQGMPAGILSLSANGSTPGTGIVWGTHMLGTTDGGIGELDAFDATIDGSGVMNKLWSSQMNPSRDQVGVIAKFNPPMVANGKVYMASFSNRLDVYGLLPTGPQTTAPVRNFFSTHNVTLTWNRTSQAIGYQVAIDDAPDFATPLHIIDIPSGDTLFTPSAIIPWLANFTYYWRVRAKYGTATYGAWSTPDIFTVSALH